eukprot:9503461-Pyramimonas_sp.AAC.1
MQVGTAGASLTEKGKNQDLWHELGQLADVRDFSEIVVLQVPSHSPAAQAVSGPHPLWVILGNTAADEVAGFAAKENRVPA